MESLRDPIILSSIALYMALCIAVGIWAMRRTTSTRDFFMAGRNLGILVAGIAMFSSTMSGFGFVGGPGLVYALGTSSFWILVTIPFGYAITDFTVGKRIRLLAGALDTISLPDLIAARYQSEATRGLSAVAIILGVLGYLATQMLAMATVLQSILISSEFWPEVSFIACVVISSSVLVFYCVTGGMLASVYTDLVQGSIMVVAAILVFIAAFAAVDGGAAGAASIIAADDPEAMGPWGTIGMFACLSWFFMFAVGQAGQPHIITKAMMIENVRSYRFMPMVTVIGYGITALLWVSIGLVMRALVLSGQHPELASADAAAPVFLQHYAHPILAGIVFAGLFAAIMSTADAFLNIGAAALTHDIPKAINRPVRNELHSARIGTIVIALASAGFALYSHYENARLIALLGVFGWGTFGAALVPTVAIGLNWKRGTAKAACTAIVASLILNFTIEVMDIPLPGGIHGGSVALLTSLILYISISLASKPPEIDPKVRAVMDI
jgi:Na+/proline symporter